MLRSKTYKTLLIIAVASAVLGLGVAQAFAERTIALSTGTIELSLAQGGSAQDTVMVANNGSEPLKAMVYTSDIRYKKSGEPEYTKPTGDASELLRSPASWLDLTFPSNTRVIANTPYVEIKPGQEIPIKFTLNVPAGAAPGDYNAAIFFEMFETSADKSGTSSKVSGRIGTRVSVRVAGDVIDQLELAPFRVRGFVIGDVVPYSFTLANKGNVDKRYSPSLVVLDTSEAERMRTLVESNSVLYAQNSRDYSGVLKLKNASFGSYIVRAEIGYNRETGSKPGATVPDKIVKDRTIFVVPTWFVILLIVVLASPILWLSVRAGTRKSRKPKVPTSAPAADGEAPASVTNA